MFYLIKTDNDNIWHYDDYRKNPSVGNHFELHKVDGDIDEYVWELRCEMASNTDEQSVDYVCRECYSSHEYEVEQCDNCDSENIDTEEEEWGEFVERATSVVIVKYDPTNPTHQEHPGYEDERPEHLRWKKKDKYDRAVEQLVAIRKYREDKLAELEHINRLLDSVDEEEQGLEKCIWELTDE